MKSPIAPLYSLSNVVTFESFVDEVLGVLFQQLDKRYVASHASFDLADWLQYFAFDVMGTMTFSSRYGFLETGKDVNGMLESIWKFMLTVGPVSSQFYLFPHVSPVVISHLCFKSRQGPAGDKKLLILLLEDDPDSLV